MVLSLQILPIALFLGLQSQLNGHNPGGCHSRTVKLASGHNPGGCHSRTGKLASSHIPGGCHSRMEKLVSSLQLPSFDASNPTSLAQLVSKFVQDTAVPTRTPLLPNPSSYPWHSHSASEIPLQTFLPWRNALHLWQHDSKKFLDKIPQLFAYMCWILHAAWKFQESAWVAYDCLYLHHPHHNIHLNRVDLAWQRWFFEQWNGLTSFKAQS